MKNPNFIKSLDTAIEGLIHCLRSQRNMRIHFLLAVSVLILGIYLNFSRIEMVILTSTVALVLFAEMINTALEFTLDLFKAENHPLVKLSKDISAGSVLITAIVAIIVGYSLFFNRIPLPIESAFVKIKQSDWHITLIILIAIISLSILGKVVFHRGSPLRGGMPSGHSAFAFSVWTLTALLQQNSIITVLVFILAILIARSRKKEHVHSIIEIVVGAGLGIMTTLLIYQVLI
jgi:diacylglycerol kinase (ATP)